MARPRIRQRPRWRAWGKGLAVVALGTALAACGTSTTTTTSTTSTTTNQATGPGSLTGYVALYPFASASAVTQWEQQYAASGADSWHLSASKSAVSFAQWLGFTQIDRALSLVATSMSAHVTVGFAIPGAANPNATVRAATVHLVRWGMSGTAPWEVVGTDDTTLTLTEPAYGATVSSPATAGGRITGVDENIKVRVRTLGSSPDVGVSCCSAAGGVASQWSRSVTFTASSGTVLTIVAQTGGHVATVERFAVTGVRAT